MHRPKWNEDWPGFGILSALLFSAILWGILLGVAVFCWSWWMTQ